MRQGLALTWVHLVARAADGACPVQHTAVAADHQRHARVVVAARHDGLRRRTLRVGRARARCGDEPRSTRSRSAGTRTKQAASSFGLSCGGRCASDHRRRLVASRRWRSRSCGAPHTHLVEAEGPHRLAGGEALVHNGHGVGPRLGRHGAEVVGPLQLHTATASSGSVAAQEKCARAVADADTTIIAAQRRRQARTWTRPCRSEAARRGALRGHRSPAARSP